ncbi:Hpt domain-containing protein [Marinomonas ostreistagni]|uniref:Hpt domain-containing protein n=1 Tax=Marinomonas ostreistagni TaxID=359209 RepID=UPI00194F4574|nr:Hpt domain-containing protein [Marinomonas ostreistagni]MBM6550603.1 Hpt domain-containing protein [Marinomonas ostreistagni]
MAIDVPQLTTLLQILGDETLQKVRQSYLDDSQDKLPQLAAAIAAQDLAAVDHLSHSLKSASANLAMLELADVFAQMEAQASQGQSDQLAALYDSAMAEYQRSVSELNAAF